MFSSSAITESVEDDAGRSWAFSDVTSSPSSSLQHTSNRPGQIDDFNSESLSGPSSALASGSSAPPKSLNYRHVNDRSSLLRSSPSSTSSLSSSSSSGAVAQHKSSKPFNLSSCTTGTSDACSSEELRMSQVTTMSLQPTATRDRTIIDAQLADELPGGAGRTDTTVEDVAAQVHVDGSLGTSENYEDDEFEDDYADDDFEDEYNDGTFQDMSTKEDAQEGMADGPATQPDRYSEDSFESYASAACVPPRVTVSFPAMVGPLLPAPQRWPPKERVNDLRLMRPLPGINHLLRRLSSKQEEVEAAHERRELQMRHEEVMREPILAVLHERLQQNNVESPSKDLSKELRRPNAVWRDVIHSRPVSDAVVNRLELSNLAHNPRSLIERNPELRALAVYQKRTVPTQLAAAVLLQAAINRATSHCVKIKLHNEWDSIALEERVHPVPLAGQASRDYMEAKAERQPQIPESGLSHTSDAHQELLRASERSRLLRMASGEVLSESSVKGGGTVSLGAKQVDASPLFMPCSSSIVSTGPSVRAAAHPQQPSAGDNLSGVCPKDNSFLQTIEASRLLQEIRIRVQGMLKEACGSLIYHRKKHAFVTPVWLESDLRTRAGMVLNHDSRQAETEGSTSTDRWCSATRPLLGAAHSSEVHLASGTDSKVTQQTLVQLLQESKQLQEHANNLLQLDQKAN